MKISIDKDTITLAKVADAKQYIADNKEWVDNDVITCCASKLLAKFHNVPFINVETILGTPSVEVTIDHYIDLCFYCRAYVAYWRDGNRIAKVHMNLNDILNDEVHGYVDSFQEADSRCC